ncbi:MAG: DNA translocase FtsK 4TM domain-containing protein, partial [Rhodobacteraceae bacterium]|nr:DNA translocase FtsK 4TM domain-containing protein [Paracoccaceae bacterium]
MASFQVRQRDPLLDQGTQAMLERRGRELIGLGLVGLALAFAAILGSYSPSDPGWMVSTQEPAQNLLGRFGAAIASTLVILIGRGAWTIPLVFLAWGLRFALHRGGERVLGRLVFAVIAVALSSAYASTLAAPASWPHTFGLGGLFGDTVAGALINALPGSNGFALKLLSLVAFFALVAMMLYVTGFDRAELAWLRHALTTGSILIYDRTMDLLGRGATGAARGAMTGARAMAERRSARTAGGAGGGAGSGADPVRFAEVPPMNARGLVRRAPPRVTADEADLAPVPLGADPGWNAPATLRAEPRRFEMAPDLPKEKLGFLARMRRVVDPQPELVEPVLSDAALAADAPLEDRVRARISDAIRARAGQIPAAATAGLSPLQAAIAARRADPPVVRPRGPVPLIADTRSGSLPPEPPVTARAMAAPPRYIPPLPVAGDPRVDALPLAADLPDTAGEFADVPPMFTARPRAAEPRAAALAAAERLAA